MKLKSTLKSMAIRCSLTLLMLFAFVSSTLSQNNVSKTVQSDEQVIRNLVQQQNEGKNVIKSTENRIFVSGAFPRPFIGKGSPEVQMRADSLKAARANFVSKQSIIRLEVAQSGDMAYEFGKK